ncbi:MAG TPA: heavy metal translocating P-type ATPase [Burkholderiaceae bacterium]|jgi:Cu+-exporting ATPase
MTVPTSHQLNITGMSCAACAGRVERALLKVEGVKAAEVNLATETARVETTTDIPLTTILGAISKAGYEGTPATVARPETESGPPLWRAMASLAISAPLLSHMLGLPMLPGLMQLVIAAIVQFGFGAGFFQGAWRALRHGSATMDVLVVLGTSAAFGLSCWNLLGPEQPMAPLYFESSALVVSLVLLGKSLEARAKRQASSAIRALQHLQPQKAVVEREGRELELPMESLRTADLVIVRPGERLPVDGVIETGESELNESLITGESMPVPKHVGDRVIAGAINGEGLLRVRCTALGAESTLARIARMVEDAQGQKAPVQRLVDRICAVFVPAVLVAALLTLLAWGAFSGDWQRALLNAVAVLVIACPCALGLATPATLIAGMGAAAQRGILVRDAQTLEDAQAITAVAFDKTGTLTEGKPRLLHHTNSDPQLMPLAAALAAGSTHPLAKAILDAKTDSPAPKVEGHSARPGRGITAQHEGESLYLGNERWMQELGLDISALQGLAADWEAQGLTVSWLARGSRVLGLLAFVDAVRAHAVEAMRLLHAQGLRTILISGDRQGPAGALARQVGISEVHAEVLPEDKARIVTELRQGGARVAMVGDGINDGPALAAADVGLAMASGTELAMAASGITLMRSDPRLVLDAIELSRRTRNTLRQNLFWAFAFNGIGIPLAAFGLLNPTLAGAAMALSSVTVLSNALLLARKVRALAH